MPKSVLEAIREGNWDFEPKRVEEVNYGATGAMPGSLEKIDIMAQRVQAGLPLWHSKDRIDHDEELYEK